MVFTGKITRFNLYQLSPYDRLQHQRARRAEAAAIAARHASFSASFAGIQQSNTQRIGDLVSKVAMQRIYKKV